MGMAAPTGDPYAQGRTLMTTTPTAETDGSATTIDLTDLGSRVDERYAERFSEAHVLEWLRTSGGSLAEQIMKREAAHIIERYASQLER